jgi:thiamine biosynthesis lipoprotein
LRVAEEALDEIDRLEAQLSVYRESSEVHRLNRAASYCAIPVEEGLFGLLELSAQLCAATEGAFDVSAGALIKAWGFYKPPPRLPSQLERLAALECTGMGHVVLDPERRTVHFLKPGLEFNLGSIGKGYALDRAAAILRRRDDFSSALLHGGHSSVYAIGTEPGDERGWLVGLSHPWETDRRLATVRLRDRALGTSAATFRHLEYNGRKLGHTLDPRSGWPAGGMAQASAIAPTAAEADALATAFYVLGIEKTRSYCESHPEVGAILLAEGATVPVFFGLARHLARLAG